MTERFRARNTEEAFWALDPFALVKPMDPWYANIERVLPAEHYGVTRQLHRRLRSTPGRPHYVHIGLLGHRGTGKSTLVRAALSGLPHILPVYINAQKELDHGDFSFADIILIAAQAVVRDLAEQDLVLDQESFTLIRDWFAERLLTEQRVTELVGEIETGAEAKGGIPWLATLMAKFTALLKSQNIYREEIRRQASQDLSDLVRRMNILLDAAHKALEPRSKTLCVVLDNLEKIGTRQSIDQEVLNRAELLRDLRCHALLFFNPSAQYAPLTTQANQAFDIVQVPALPVRERGDSPDVVLPAAVEAVERILDLRLELSGVFEEPRAAVEALTRWSGGRLRDMLWLARTAVENADPDRVSIRDIERAVGKLAGERLVLAHADHWPRLAAIAKNKQVANEADDAVLLQHSLVLNYNGSPWWDVHPVVRTDPRFERESAKLES